MGRDEVGQNLTPHKRSMFITRAQVRLRCVSTSYRFRFFPRVAPEASPHVSATKPMSIVDFGLLEVIDGSMIRTIVITGAASGIGQALPPSDTRGRGVHGLSGFNAAGLADVSERCRALGSDVYSRKIDVRERAALGAHGWSNSTMHGQSTSCSPMRV